MIFLYSGSQAGSHERRLLNDLMNSYQKLGKLGNTINKKSSRALVTNNPVEDTLDIRNTASPAIAPTPSILFPNKL